MKEYLVKGYLLGKEKDQDWFFHEYNFKKKDKDAIEIPEGATIAVHYNRNDKIYFWKDDETHFVGGYWLDCKTNGLTTLDSFLTNWEGCCTIVWKRHTQPEELPFVDDGNDDNVNHPSHYASGAIECIDAIESSMTKEAFAGFLKGNVQKYMWRYENKGGVESLQKAQWYLNRLILLQSA